MNTNFRRNVKFAALFFWFAATTAVVAWTWHDTTLLQNEINDAGKNSSAYRCYYSSRGAAVTWLSNAQERDAVIGTAIAVIIVLWVLHCCVFRKVTQAASLKAYLVGLGIVLVATGLVIGIPARNYLHKTKNIKRTCDLPVRVAGLGLASFGMLLVLIGAIAYFGLMSGSAEKESADASKAEFLLKNDS